MGGICGVVLNDSKTRLSSEGLCAMARALRMADCGEGKEVNLGPVGLAVHPDVNGVAEISVASVTGYTVAVALFGTIYEVEGVSLNQDIPLAQQILNLYAVQGIGMVRTLRGDFALAIWDGRDQSIRIATDRFRIHPIFYSCIEGQLIFASRMQAVMASQYWSDGCINPRAVVDLMAASAIATPDTIFKDVQKLPPGYLLTWRSGVAKSEPYWNLNFLVQDVSSRAVLAQRLKDIFNEAMSCRLQNDRNRDDIGTFLSGGIDSSTVTGVLTHLSGRPVKSFSIAFDEDQFNEISYARLVAKQFGAEHYEYTVTPEDTLKVLPLLIDTFDEPFANASSVPTYYCAQLARHHGVRVLYAGDGGDELFGGNKRYAEQRLFDIYHQIPLWVRGILRPLAFSIAELTHLSLFVKSKKYITRASIPYPDRLYSYGFFMSFPTQDLFADDFLSMAGPSINPYESMCRHYWEAPASSELDRQLYLDLKLAISDNDLFKVTRMTQSAGVAVRFPFLDHRLAEFAATVPADIKMKGRELRTFFKYAYSDLLPEAVRNKTKHGFGLPIPVWLHTDKKLRDLLHDLVLSERAVQRGYFKRRGLERLVQLHQAEPSSLYGAVLWNLMILELWHRQYVDRRPETV